MCECSSVVADRPSTDDVRSRPCDLHQLPHEVLFHCTPRCHFICAFYTVVLPCCTTLSTCPSLPILLHSRPRMPPLISQPACLLLALLECHFCCLGCCRLVHVIAAFVALCLRLLPALSSWYRSLLPAAVPFYRLHDLVWSNYL